MQITFACHITRLCWSLNTNIQHYSYPLPSRVILNTNTHYSCPPPFTGDKRCANTSLEDCSGAHFCYNGGTCRVESSGFHRCDCIPGFSGEFFEWDEAGSCSSFKVWGHRLPFSCLQSLTIYELIIQLRSLGACDLINKFTVHVRLKNHWFPDF